MHALHGVGRPSHECDVSAAAGQFADEGEGLWRRAWATKLDGKVNTLSLSAFFTTRLTNELGVRWRPASGTASACSCSR